MVTISRTMMTWKTKKKRFNPLFDCFLRPHSPLRHLSFVRPAVLLAALVCLSVAASPAKPAAARQSSGRSHAHDYVIFVTVFTDRSFALYGAHLRVRRSDEKKFRWEAMSDHQGELAFRVPEGAEYEMTVEARGFKPETRKIDAREGNRVDLTIRMEPLTDSSAAPHAETHAGDSTGGKP
jgi:hypothetical protein